MGFEHFWQRVRLPGTKSTGFIQEVCKAAYEKGFEDGFDAGRDEGYHEGRDVGRWDWETDLRLIK